LSGWQLSVGSCPVGNCRDTRLAIVKFYAITLLLFLNSFDEIDDGKMRYNQARNQGWRSPLQNFSPPFKNVLDIVENYWA